MRLKRKQVKASEEWQEAVGCGPSQRKRLEVEALKQNNQKEVSRARALTYTGNLSRGEALSLHV